MTSPASISRPSAQHPPLVLASESPRRIELLRQILPEFGIAASFVSELHDPAMPPRQLCETNAKRKAFAVGERYPHCLVLGADTLVFLDQQPLGKPSHLDDARAMLRQLSGRIHEVITGVCLIHPASHRISVFSESTRVQFRTLTPTDIDEYLSRVHVLDKAGAYAIQEHGSLIIEQIEGSRTNVVGLPLEAVQKALAAW